MGKCRIATTSKAHPGPNVPIIRPPIAGPVARAALNWVEFRAIAFGKTDRGTHSATNACQTGSLTPLINPPAVIKNSQGHGLSRPEFQARAITMAVTA